MNNHLTMGRGRWLCYAANVERRRREGEEAERRPGVRPLVVREWYLNLQDFYVGRGLGKRIFIGTWQGGGVDLP